MEEGKAKLLFKMLKVVELLLTTAKQCPHMGDRELWPGLCVTARDNTVAHKEMHVLPQDGQAQPLTAPWTSPGGWLQAVVFRSRYFLPALHPNTGSLLAPRPLWLVLPEKVKSRQGDPPGGPLPSAQHAVPPIAPAE